MKEMTLGQVIAKQREALSITQRDLAFKIGINNSTISRLEKDPKISADPKTLKAIAGALNLDYNYLLSLNHTIDDSAELRMIARASKNMTQNQLDQMVDILKKEFAEAFYGTESDGVLDTENKNK